MSCFDADLQRIDPFALAVFIQDIELDCEKSFCIDLKTTDHFPLFFPSEAYGNQGDKVSKICQHTIHITHYHEPSLGLGRESSTLSQFVCALAAPTRGEIKLTINPLNHGTIFYALENPGCFAVVSTLLLLNSLSSSRHLAPFPLKHAGFALKQFKKKLPGLT